MPTGGAWQHRPRLGAPEGTLASISFVLPAGVGPDRANLPGIVRAGRWSATFVAPPAEGIAWEASFAGASPEQLAALSIAVTAGGVPGAPAGNGCPPWFPQDRIVWTAWTTWVLDPPFRHRLSPCHRYGKLRNRYGEGRNATCYVLRRRGTSSDAC